MDPPPQILGEFRIRAVLGQGGSGIVYDASWGPRRVALKVLHPNLVGTGKERAQYVTEAQRLQQLTHPSVVKVFAVGELPDGRPYLAMERLEGETLAAVLARGALALPAARAMFEDLCGAVGALHDKGLVHRDLKPENVFVVDGKHAVLLDFGIAKDLAAPPSTTTQEGNVRGTPAYMAPERFFGQPASLATDVYELALVLYAMLAGRLPWDDLADPEGRLAPRPLTELAVVPEALDVAIRRALSTRAQNRPPSAAALLAAVREATSASAAAGEPAVTAKLRQEAEPPRAPSDRAPTPEQPTPLAWAPTVAVPRGASRGSRRTWWLAGAGAIAAMGAGIAYVKWPSADDPSGPARAVRTVTPVPPDTGPPRMAQPGMVPPDKDPWNGAPVPLPEPERLPLVEQQRSQQIYRAEAAAAVARLPADTRFIFTAEIGELRAQRQIADLLDKAAKDPRLGILLALVTPCVRAAAAQSEWIVVGGPTLHDTVEKGTFVLRGRWERKDIERCLDDTTKHVTADHHTMFQIGDDGWLDFIDDHTIYVALETRLDADTLHALVRRGVGPGQHARELFARLPADHTLAVALDGAANDDFSGTLALPRGSDVFGWLRVDRGGVELDVAADPHDVAAAQVAAARLRSRVDGAFRKTRAEVVGKLEVVIDHTAVHLRGNVTALMLSIVASSL
jgi:serine/threonine-protein kinase